MSDPNLLLAGPDGGNPLGFLSTLGLLRTLSQESDLAPVRLHWVAAAGWKPELSFGRPTSLAEVVERVHSRLSHAADRPEFTSLGKNLTASREDFHRFLDAASKDSTPTQRTTADFGASFGSDALVGDEGKMVDTAWRTMAGAGHQHFLETMRKLIQETNRLHFERALGATWRYDDPMETLSLRLDPLDDRRYALQARNPSGDPARKSGGSVQGANRLAIEGLPLFPTAATDRHLHTTGFRGQRASDTFFTWPIWTRPAGIDVVRSLLTLRELTIVGTENRLGDISPNGSHLVRQARARLQEMGISEIFRSQRLTIGKVRNFTPARSV